MHHQIRHTGNQSQTKSEQGQKLWANTGHKYIPLTVDSIVDMPGSVDAGRLAFSFRSPRGLKVDLDFAHPIIERIY